jgi:hypothetical protein
MKCLHIDIHNPDGCYGSTDRTWYDIIPTRKQILESYYCQHMIESGYIIGNIYTTDSVKRDLEYCNETDAYWSEKETA